ncbi:uncharacterized protein LOC135379153 [Ornithodoros turicata]|uniref:uncharacterized protein LOC135379153 n=1 Tax=Ornithodoros turicata TaxID=34597 RepID=UPI00313A21F3
MPNLRYFQCPRCQHRAFTLNSLLRHLSSSHGCERNWACDLGKCARTYTSLSRFREHLLKTHSSDQPQCVDSSSVQPDTNVEHVDNMESSDDDNAEAIPQSAQQNASADLPSTSTASTSTLRPTTERQNPVKEFAMLLLKWKEAKKLPESTLNEIANDMFNFFNDCGPQLFSAQGSDVEPSVNSEMGQLLTKKGRERFWTGALPYVEPVTVTLNEAGEARVSFQYVPILEVLRHYVEWLDNSFTSDPCRFADTLSSVFDASAFASHEYFCGDREKLCIQLYTDEFEVCNPIGAQRQKHKLMAVYYTLLNVPSRLRAQLSHIHLALLCKEKHIQKYGFDRVLERLHQDIAHLETEGITVHNKMITGSVFCLSGDNLSSHRIGGFKASFNHGHICRFCMALHHEIRTKHKEQDFVLRTPALHKFHLDMLRGGVATLPLYGLKAPSAVHTKGFHPTEHLPPDVMHDLHEGVIPFVLRHFIRYFISQRLFSLDVLNERILNFAYDQCDKKNKPEPISQHFLSSGGVMRGCERLSIGQPSDPVACTGSVPGIRKEYGEIVATSAMQIRTPSDMWKKIPGADRNVLCVRREVPTQECWRPIIQDTEVEIFNDVAPQRPLAIPITASPHRMVRVHVTNYRLGITQSTKSRPQVMHCHED